MDLGKICALSAYVRWLALVAAGTVATPATAWAQATTETDTSATDETADDGPTVDDDTFDVPPPTPPSDPEPAPSPPAPTTQSDVEEITITGSRIRRIDLTSPAPVTVLGRQDLEASGMVDIADILQNLPSQGNAVNVQANNGGDGSARVNLRGLDEERTLVLLNGRRFVKGGTGANASVDLNSIPAAIIERVEVLKDGASAVYGSDAIAGVVNIITRQEFDGAEGSVYVGQTPDGNSRITDLALTIGQSTDRGFIMFSAGYYTRSEFFAGERDFSRSALNLDWNTGVESTIGSATTPQGTVELTGSSSNGAFDNISENATGPALYNDPVTGWRTFDTRGNSDVGEGDFYNFQPENYLVTPQDRFNLFSLGSFEFHPNVRGYFEASYTNRTSDQKLAPTPLDTGVEGLTVSRDNYYNPFGRDLARVRRRMVEAGTRNFIQDLTTFRFLAGFDGSLPNDIPGLGGWFYDVNASYGLTEGTEINQGRFVRSRVANAVGPSFIDANGLPRCGTSGTAIEGCIPLNLFGGPGTITEDMLNYIRYQGAQSGFTEQTMVQANLTGELVELWAGPVALAAGYEFRRERGAQNPDPITELGDTTGNKARATRGGFRVNEGYAELSIPLLADMPAFDYLELNAATRFFDYSNFGSDAIWKLGSQWRITQDITLRGTYSTAFRAPSLGELFDGEADAFPQATDPCSVADGPRSATANAQCQAQGVPDNFTNPDRQQRTIVGGNEDLEPETANTFTAGLVFTPRWVEGLSLTLDYFDIEIENSIQAIGATVILADCYQNGNQASCDKITRGAGSNIVSISNLQTNIGGVETAGIDLAVRYDFGTTIGRWLLNFDGTWLLQYDEIQADGNVVQGLGTYDLAAAYPELKFNVGAIWGMDDWSAGYNFRFIGGFEECRDNECFEGEPVRGVDANVTMDIWAGYRLGSALGSTDLRVGINNFLDQTPPLIYNGFLANSDAQTYDYLGRYLYVRLSHSL